VPGPTEQLQRDLDVRFPRLRAYLTLTRFDKPIGTYLLLWPTLMALWVAAEGWPGWHLFFVFVLGTLLTRSAGCVLNDLTDRQFDGSVKRTHQRPLVTGQIGVGEAWLLAAVLLFLALILVLTTNLLTLILSVGAVAVTAAYPFMKRYTYLPQAVLGVAFSWGILMAFSAATNEIAQVAWLLLIANLLWVVAYDTEYAMVDRDDDIKLGLKSTAILFADLDRPMIGILQISSLVTLLLVGRTLEMSPWYYLGLCGAAGLFLFQHYLIRHRQRDDCFDAFLSNHWVGLSLFLGVIVHYAIK
jgi:4-hydroxybenzoate polyprenyltransferase